MKIEKGVAAAAIGVVVVSVLAAVVVPGVFAGPADEPGRQGSVQVEEVPIAPGDITGETATLQVESRLSHWGPATENVTVLFRVTDAESNLVETDQTVDVGTLSGSRETPVRANLTVDREGGYEIETVVFRDGERVDVAGRRVSGLEALTPAYAESNVVFGETAALQPVSVAISASNDDDVSLDLSAALTNEGDESTDDLEVTFTARQAESNVVADRVTVPVGGIRAGRTATVDAEVTVPDEYNYYVDAILWRDGVYVDSAQTVANLDPEGRISADDTETQAEFEASDFESSSGRSDDRAGDGMSSPAEETAASEETPGFGLLAGFGALLATALVVRRRST